MANSGPSRRKTSIVIQSVERCRAGPGILQARPPAPHAGWWPVRADLLMRLEPLMRLGAHWGQVQAAGQIVITGADKPRLLLQPLRRWPAAPRGRNDGGCKIHQPETRHIQRVGQLGKINRLCSGYPAPINAGYLRHKAGFDFTNLTGSTDNRVSVMDFGTRKSAPKPINLTSIKAI